MSGAASRSKGNRWERHVAAYLRDRTVLDVRTGRDGRGGAQTDSDLQWRDDDGRWWPGILGWTVECKDVAGSAVPSWLEQARQAAKADRNDWWCVIVKRRRRPTGDAAVYMPPGMLADYIGTLEPALSYPLGNVSLSLNAWLEVLA